MGAPTDDALARADRRRSGCGTLGSWSCPRVVCCCRSRVGSAWLPEVVTDVAPLGPRFRRSGVGIERRCGTGWRLAKVPCQAERLPQDGRCPGSWKSFAPSRGQRADATLTKADQGAWRGVAGGGGDGASAVRFTRWQCGLIRCACRCGSAVADVTDVARNIRRFVNASR